MGVRTKEADLIVLHVYEGHIEKNGEKLITFGFSPNREYHCMQSMQ